MKKRHAITPTDQGKPLPANPQWRRAEPSVVRLSDGRDWVWLDAYHAVTLPAQHQAAADKRGNGKDWGRAK